MNNHSRVEVSDDLKSNFRSWEYDNDNKEDTEKLARELKSRHKLTFNEAYEIAADWTGYSNIIKDE